jgi:adenylate cyclase
LQRSVGYAEKTEVILRLAETARRQTQFVDLANTVSDSLSLDVLFPRLMEVMTETLGADRSSLFLHDPETNELFSRVMQGSVMGEVRFAATLGIAGAVFASGEGRIIPDAYADPLVQSRSRPALRLSHAQHPLRTHTQQKARGYRHHPGAQQAQRRFLTRGPASPRSTIASGGRRPRKRADLREDRAGAARGGLAARGRELHRFGDSPGAAAAKDHRRGNPAARCRSWIAVSLRPGPQGALLAGRRRRHYPGNRFPSDAGIAGECFTAVAPINIPDAYADDRFNPEVDKQTGYKTNNMLCMPITTKHGNSVGVMQILNKATGSFGPGDEKRLVALCAQAAVSIENAQFFAQVNAARNYNEGILRSMSNGVVTMDASWNITKVNQAATRILRQSGQKLEGKTAQEVLGTRNAWILNSLGKVRSSGETDITVDADLLLEDHASVSINLTAVPLVTTRDQPMGYMLVIEDITREKRLRNTMSRYMSKAVVDQLLESGDATLSGVDREVSVLFSDIRGFTSISERLGARETIVMLNEYFTDMVDIVFAHNGILDKYIGDMIMAVFGSVMAGDSDADDAVEVGNRMMTGLRLLNQRRVNTGREPIHIGVGVSTGHVVVGNIGSPKRLEYTVIGDRVNLAERLESANKYYGTSVLLCQFTAAKLKRPALLREIDLIRVRGSTQPFAVFEALDHHTEKSFSMRGEVLQAYAEGLRLYRQRDWVQAATCFHAASNANPGDKPSSLFLERCRQYIETPPPEGWDGVWAMGHH